MPRKNKIVVHSITVGTTAVKALEEDKSRLAWRIYVPLETADLIFVGYDSRVSVTLATRSHVRIAPGQPPLEESGSDAYQGEIWLISPTAGNVVYVEEVLR